jgi:uncharacterized membrane protein YagU involved in acid resistance
MAKSVFAGAVAGLVGCYAMDLFHRAVASATAEEPSPSSEGEDATQRTASAISHSLFRPLRKRDKETAGPIVHYAFGALMGAAYGALRVAAPGATSVGGVPFSAAIWLGADEVAVPALGLGASPMDAPVSQHASALTAHAVYGIVLEVVHGGILKAIGD